MRRKSGAMYCTGWEAIAKTLKRGWAMRRWDRRVRRKLGVRSAKRKRAIRTDPLEYNRVSTARTAVLSLDRFEGLLASPALKFCPPLPGRGSLQLSATNPRRAGLNEIRQTKELSCPGIQNGPRSSTRRRQRTPNAAGYLRA